MTTWTLILIVITSHGVSTTQIPGFRSEQTCKTTEHRIPENSTLGSYYGVKVNATTVCVEVR